MSKVKASMSRIVGLSLIVLLLGGLGLGLTALGETTNFRMRAANSVPACEDFKSIHIESCGKLSWLGQTNKCKTERRNVELTLDSVGSKQMHFKEIDPKTTCELTDATGWTDWENYATKRALKLSGNFGNKKVCVTFKNDLGESRCKANIKYVGGVKPANPTAKSGGRNSPGSEDDYEGIYAVKEMYYTGNCSYDNGAEPIGLEHYDSFNLCRSAIAPIIKRGTEYRKNGDPWYKYAEGGCNPLSSSHSYDWSCYCDCLDASCSNCN